MKKAFGIAILASLFATPAFAGETFVDNTDHWSNSTTNTNLHLDSYTNSIRDEKYNSWADKDYKEAKRTDGSTYSFNENYDGSSSCKSYQCEFSSEFSIASTQEAFDKFGYSHNTAGADLNGTYKETNNTRVYGTIDTVTNAYTDGHTTSAGVR
ncbi:hypothetical protein [Merismopedia glauca]|uniref:Uncharacterized protein n=1 Tax=Merismopedia glauca CCAP 1448/3 TaxID=1296344 RepID=A0A2T1C5L3_9CYAN|nr:hypothetical protein [Merismopedia glauca]PSB03572.1 hypothetical protein C7B64_07940 [Merismopedia glauca CCAP 1448/3]